MSLIWRTAFYSYLLLFVFQVNNLYGLLLSSPSIQAFLTTAVIELALPHIASMLSVLFIVHLMRESLNVMLALTKNEFWTIISSFWTHLSLNLFSKTYEQYTLPTTQATIEDINNFYRNYSLSREILDIILIASIAYLTAPQLLFSYLSSPVVTFLCVMPFSLIDRAICSALISFDNILPGCIDRINSLIDKTRCYTQKFLDHQSANPKLTVNLPASQTASYSERSSQNQASNYTNKNNDTFTKSKKTL